MKPYKCTYRTSEGILNNMIVWAHTLYDAMGKIEKMREVSKIYIINGKWIEL